MQTFEHNTYIHCKPSSNYDVTVNLLVNPIIFLYSQEVKLFPLFHSKQFSDTLGRLGPSTQAQTLSEAYPGSLSLTILKLCH